MGISIIIVNWNTKELLIECINSIVRSHPVTNYEIIVVDNGSADGSQKTVEKLKAQISNLKLVENKENLGFARANNQGIRKAKGKYILLLNSDTIVKKGAIDSLVEFASDKKDAGVVGSRLLNKDGSIQASVFRFPTLKRAVAQYWFGKRGLLDKYYPSGNKPCEVEALVGASFLITPEAIKRVGLLDERYFMYFEDLDYCRRARRASLKVYYLPQAEVVHLHGASGKKLSSNRDNWRRLVPSSKIYHGFLKHYVFNFVLWSGQKWEKFVR